MTRPSEPCTQAPARPPRPSPCKQANRGPSGPDPEGGAKEIAGRLALAAAYAWVTIRYARKPEFMGIYCVRGPSAPKSQHAIPLLATEFALDGGAR
jgi:hypothetical protein